MNTNCEKKQETKRTFTKQDIWDLLFWPGMLLAAMLIRYAMFLPRF